LINPDRVKVPVRLRKSLRVVAHKINAAVSAPIDGLVLRTIGVIGVNLPSPITAKVRVDDDAHVAEVLVDFARALLVHRRHAEVRDVWCAAGDADWDGAAGEEPVLDVV
jgi:hypothetical protein